MAELSEILVGSTNFTNTDTNVKQTATTGNANYEVLFSNTADNTTRTEGARKASNLTFNPSTGNLTATKFTGDISEGTGLTDTQVTTALGYDPQPTKTASGAIATFSDGADLPMPSFICNIDAVQDLHGYDHPWVGGAGKNKLPLVLADIKANNTEGTWNGNTYIYNGVTIEVLQDINGNVNGFKFNGTSSSTINFRITRYNIENLPTGDYIYNIQNIIDIDNLWVSLSQPQAKIIKVKDSTNVKVSITSGQVFGGGYIYSNAGNVFNNVLIQPMLRLTTETDPTFAPYSNICPISGHTGVDAWVFGKNILPYPYTDTTKSLNNVTFTDVGDGTIKTSGTASARTIFKLKDAASNYTPPKGTYIVSKSYQNAYTAIVVDGYNGNTWAKSLGRSSSVDDTEIVVDYDGYDRVTMYVEIANGIDTSNMTFKPMMRLATIADATYEPYNPNSQTIQVSWQTEAGEVFGGYVDLVSGVLTVVRVSTTINGNNINYVSASSQTDVLGGKRLSTNIANAKYTNNTAIPNIDSDRLVAVSANSIFSDTGSNCVSVNDLNQITLRYKGAATLEDAQDLLNAEPVQLVYELATPITYQLTPQQIKSLLGNNNAWCSTGDVNVKYITQPYTDFSTKQYVDDAIATAITDALNASY